METGFTTATWLWLFVPMPLLVLISLVSWLRHAGASDMRHAGASDKGGDR